MDGTVTWKTDGFRLRLEPRSDGSVPMLPLAAMYALCAPSLVAAAVDPALVPLLGSFLLPLPSALCWSVFRPRAPVVVDVDHQRLVVRGRLGRRQVLPIRAIRAVGVRLDGLDLELGSGKRVAVAIPGSLARLSWLAARLTELCDEVRAFEEDVRGRRGDSAQVRALTRAVGR
ncbi:MAG: hypothetical protein R3F59_22255 [Myxococcota bacterium]